MSLIVPLIKTIFNGVRPSWRRILTSKEIKPILDKCFIALEEDLVRKGVTAKLVAEHGMYNYIRPAPEYILQPMKYIDVKNIRAIGIGQDPYTNLIDAHGLSFSSGRGTKPPASLKKIYECLEHYGLMQPTNLANLTGWAKQGIVLLNAYLTRTPNITRTQDGCIVEGNGGSDKRNLHLFWEELTGAILAYITRTTEHDIYIMLWGNNARELKRYIVPGKFIHILEWGHPSPLNNANRDPENAANFKYCDHFRHLSRAYPMIDFNPSYTTDENLLDQFWSYRVERARDTETDPRKVSAYNVVSRLIDIGDPKTLYDDGTDTEENLRIREYIKMRTAKRTSNESILKVKPEPVNIKTPESFNDMSSAHIAKTPEVITNQKPILVCVDGGCRGNNIANNPNAKASWGVWFAPSVCGLATLSGELNKSGVLSKFIMAYDKTRDDIVETAENTRATNQRAELMAVIVALQTLCRMDLTNVSSITIVSDSLKYVISWLGGRLWREYAKDKKFTKIINRDLVILICRFIYNLGRKFIPNCTFEEVETLMGNRILIQHINSHLKPNEYACLTAVQREYSAGNDAADKLCNAVLDGMA